MNDDNKKPKPTIEPIKIDPDKLKKFNTILNGRYSPFSKAKAIRDLAGGLCHGCAQIPTKILK